MIKIICVGKLKEKYWVSAIEEYSKRLSKYTKLDIIEVPDYDKFDMNKILDSEKNEIMKHINNRDYIICMDIQGKTYTSEEFSDYIEKIQSINSNICFIIGGSYGIHNDIKNISNELISFSKMTFPHQLFRVLLLEQIYRGYKIMNNESYHK